MGRRKQNAEARLLGSRISASRHPNSPVATSQSSELRTRGLIIAGLTARNDAAVEPVADDRMTSVASEALSASRTSSRANWDRAIVWIFFESSLAGSDEASHDGSSTFGNQARSYTTPGRHPHHLYALGRGGRDNSPTTVTWRAVMISIRPGS